jgi:hypothetical protein
MSVGRNPGRPVPFLAIGQRAPARTDEVERPQRGDRSDPAAVEPGPGPRRRRLRRHAGTSRWPARYGRSAPAVCSRMAATCWRASPYCSRPAGCQDRQPPADGRRPAGCAGLQRLPVPPLVAFAASAGSRAVSVAGLPRWELTYQAIAWRRRNCWSDSFRPGRSSSSGGNPAPGTWTLSGAPRRTTTCVWVAHPGSARTGDRPIPPRRRIGLPGGPGDALVSSACPRPPPRRA